MTPRPFFNLSNKFINRIQLRILNLVKHFYKKLYLVLINKLFKSIITSDLTKLEFILITVNINILST